MVVIAFAGLTQIDRDRHPRAARSCPSLDGHKLIFTHPTDSFSIYLNDVVDGQGLIAALARHRVSDVGLPVAGPVTNTRRTVVVPVAVGAVVLFLCGVSLSYFAVMPLALRWLLAFQTASMEPLISGLEYFDFLFTMSLAFGLCFELPIVVRGLDRCWGS